MPGGGEPLQLELLAASSEASAPPSARIIAEWLAKIGIGVRVRSIGDGAMSQAWSRGAFDAYLWGWNVDPDPDFILSIFTTEQCGSWSDGCYSDPAYDAMYQAQRTATSVDERRAIIDDMEAYVYEYLPEIVLYYESDMEAYRTDRFSGFTAFPPPDGNLVFGWVSAPYMAVRPVIATDGGAPGASSSAIPLWVWAAVAVAIVGAVVVIAWVRRSGEDERI